MPKVTDGAWDNRETINMIKIIAVLHLLVFFVSSCAVEQARLEPKQGEERADAPSYNQGSAWQYRLKRQTLVSSSTDEIGKGGEFLIEPFGNSVRIFRLETNGRIPVRRIDDLSMMLPTAAVLQSPMKVFDFPLFVGKSWTNWFFAERRWLRAKNEVAAIETVTTPAGSFRAFRIDRLIDVLYSSGNIWFSRWTIYYSPETRSVVKLSYTGETKLDGLETAIEIELLKYSAIGSGDKQQAAPPSAQTDTDPSRELVIEVEAGRRQEPPPRSD